MKYFFYLIWEVAEVVLVSLIAVIVVRNFLIQPFLVNGASMEPNFHDGDYLIVDEISYRFRESRRGEVIVFHYPNNKNSYLIKRIIGLPGERLEIKDGKIFIFNKIHKDGLLVEENYLPPYTETVGEKSIVLGDSEYFVMGDNRNFSFDSRNWGPLKQSEIVGSVRLRLWPLNRAMAFKAQTY